MAYMWNGYDLRSAPVHVARSAAFNAPDHEVRITAVDSLFGLVRGTGSQLAFDVMHELLLRGVHTDVKLQVNLRLDEFMERPNTYMLLPQALDDTFPTIAVHSVMAIGLRAKLLDEDEAVRALRYIGHEALGVPASRAIEILTILQRA